MGLLNFPIRCIFYFIVEKKLFSIYTNKGVGSFSTPRLNTCTIFATERQEDIQCYCEGTLGLVFLSIVVFHCIRGFVSRVLEKDYLIYIYSCSVQMILFVLQQRRIFGWKSCGNRRAWI